MKAGRPTPSSSDTLLDAWRVDRDEARRREAKALDRAIGWMTSIAGPGPADQEFLYDIPLGGQGCPELPETCVAEFAAVAGMTTTAARSYLADAWDLCWRFPELRTRVRDGSVELWRARTVASTLRALPVEGARYVDQIIAPIAHQIGPARLRRMVILGEILSDPDAAVARAHASAGARSISLYPSTSADGLMDLFGRLDYADAHDLEAALQMVAAELAEPDGAGESDPDDIEPLDVRRSKALGLIARRQLAGTTGSATPEEAAVTRVVHTYVHLHPDTPVATVEQGPTLVPVERVQEWCETAGTKVVIRPVLDLATTHTRDGYVPTDLMREQAIAINRTCVHPYCTHPARDADLDHIESYNPHGPPGQTTSTNLAPLCRFHHRLKTHANWTYQRLTPGHYQWRSPAGRDYLRTPTGTTPIDATPDG